MASTINASTTGAGGVITTADNTGNLNIQSNGTTVLGVTSSGVAVTGTLTQSGNNVLTSASLGSSAQAYSANLTEYAATGVNMRNRIINGDMRIDQRNAGASVTPSGDLYTLDRWWANMNLGSKFSVQQVSDAPTGFNNSLKVTSTSAYSVGAGDYFWIAQKIEGYNLSDLNFGTANAKTFTISFWAKSSITGTFSVMFVNSAENRTYATTYTISSANTWEYKTITVAGDQSGTWVGATNGVGIKINFAIGLGSNYYGTLNTWTSGVYGTSGQVNIVATNGATWQITGVQLEVGSTATPFERRQYGQELALCQRYYYLHVSGTAQFIGTGWMYDASNFACSVTFPVTMRTTPTLSATSGTNYYSFDRNGGADSFNSLTITRPQTNATSMYNNTEMSGTAGHAGMTYTNSASSFIALQAEL